MKTTSLIISLIAVAALTGCGGGGSSSSDGGSSSGGGSSSSAGGGSGIVAYTCSDSVSYGGVLNEVKSGYEGDISYDCKLTSMTQGFHLNVGSMTVTDITKVETIDGTFNGERIQGTATYDYKNATIHYKVSGSKHGSFDCTEYYNPFLPVTIANDEEAQALMEGNNLDYTIDYFDVDGPNFKNTTCPSSFYDDTNDNWTSGEGTVQDDYTVKDNSGKTHKISIWQHFKM
jgi:hypothetical protein